MNITGYFTQGWQPAPPQGGQIFWETYVYVPPKAMPEDIPSYHNESSFDRFDYFGREWNHSVIDCDFCRQSLDSDYTGIYQAPREGEYISRSHGSNSLCLVTDGSCCVNNFTNMRTEYHWPYMEVTYSRGTPYEHTDVLKIQDGPQVTLGMSDGVPYQDPWNFPGTSNFSSFIAKRDFDRGALTKRAVSNLRDLDINSLSYIKEAPTVISTLTSAVKDVRKALKGDLKAAARGYLALSYGTLNTIRDTKDILTYITKTHKGSGRNSSHGSAIIDASGICYSLECRDTCTVDFNEVKGSTFDSAVEGLRALDLLPSLENAWDFVPYSFVVDWMLPVGDILSSIDAAADLARLDITGAYYSRYITFSSKSPFGSMNATYYWRENHASAVCPIGVDSYSSSGSSNHFLEASALIVQRT